MTQIDSINMCELKQQSMPGAAHRDGLLVCSVRRGGRRQRRGQQVLRVGNAHRRQAVVAQRCRTRVIEPFQDLDLR